MLIFGRLFYDMVHRANKKQLEKDVRAQMLLSFAYSLGEWRI